MKNRVTYNIMEVSELLGISISKCYQLVKNNTIPHLQIDGRYVVPVNAFDNWLNNSVIGGVAK